MAEHLALAKELGVAAGAGVVKAEADLEEMEKEDEADTVGEEKDVEVGSEADEVPEAVARNSST